MDAIRKQLDVLMGANRNGDVTEVNRKYYDRDVCRLYLVGLCPHELFQLTKMDMGPCPKVHSLQLRKEYEEAKAKIGHNYDRDLEDVIDRLIVECDRKISRALKRLEDDDAKAAIAISVSEVTQTPEVLELSKQIKEKLIEVDQLDLEGLTDNKIRALELVEELRAKRADKQSTLLLDAFNKDRASLPQPLLNPPPLAPLPVLAPPDLRTQEMINEKLKKAEDLGIYDCYGDMELKNMRLVPHGFIEPLWIRAHYKAYDIKTLSRVWVQCSLCSHVRVLNAKTIFEFLNDSSTDEDAMLLDSSPSDNDIADAIKWEIILNQIEINNLEAEESSSRRRGGSAVGRSVLDRKRRIPLNIHGCGHSKLPICGRFLKNFVFTSYYRRQCLPKLGEQGMVDEAQKALEEAEALKKLAARQEPGMDTSKYTAADVRITDQKLRVCDICGAFLSVYDSDRRLADHFGGKLHLGYMQIREKLAELQEERNKSRKVDQSEGDRRSKERSRDADRASSRDRDNDRVDRGNSRDRGRDQDRMSRDRDRHHDRERGYERERGADRSRNYDSRSRRRSRSRSRDRGPSRDYDRHRRYDRF
ncbi:hypothetical protein GIB67_008362 [Kingdonia uniflora]|uniref:RNA-binding protein Luc7-like 2 n=1 Tax=Kingdonia uniflora TaxID=39325 RepID=A0A7J7N539_9MAGN|nr:hypothetical protein GIB67_008362 [Kingdonia uniflora]